MSNNTKTKGLRGVGSKAAMLIAFLAILLAAFTTSPKEAKAAGGATQITLNGVAPSGAERKTIVYPRWVLSATNEFEANRACPPAIAIDQDAELRPHLRRQRDVCSSERTLQRWLSENELSCRHLWYYAAKERPRMLHVPPGGVPWRHALVLPPLSGQGGLAGREQLLF